eukprot:TRINITY_DN2692_c0_g1_i2.p1 TRINITY_DN2692_c0_g1~~TRINITY_DN2692_c0_g1_i2.p1  ORF type:complete len:181 (-),score=37.53 TRINITY_DN2692_c0_g1_i2:53-595(-)
MEHAQMQDSFHTKIIERQPMSKEQMLDMQTHNLSYISHKRLLDAKKVEALQQSIFADQPKKPNHIIFVDDEKEKANFDPVKYYDTVPEALALGITHNIPKRENLENAPVILNSGANIAAAAKDFQKTKLEIRERLKRLKRLEDTERRMRDQKTRMTGVSYTEKKRDDGSTMLKLKKERKR